MNPVRGIETIFPNSSVEIPYPCIFQINESRSRDWNRFPIFGNWEDSSFKLMNPVRGIETFHSRLIFPVKVPIFQINESRSRDWNEYLERLKSFSISNFQINESRSRDWNKNVTIGM